MAETNLYRIEVGLREDQPDPAAQSVPAQFRSLGLPAPDRVRAVRIFWVEGAFDRTMAELLGRELFADPITEKAAVDAPVYGADGSFVRVPVHGAISGNAYVELEETVAKFFRSKQYNLIFDLGEVTEVSSAGVGVFIGAFTEAQENGGLVLFENIRPQLRELFQSLGFMDVIVLAEKKRPEASPPPRSVEIVRKPGVMDPVVASIRKALLDRGLSAGYIGTGRKYLFWGDLSDDTLRAAGRRILANESIEEVHVDRPAPVHKISGAAEFKLVHVPLKGKDDAELAQISKLGCLSLTVPEMRSIQAHYDGLGRDPTDVELETVAQTWSEHCRHKTLKGVVNFTGPEGKKRYENLLKETIVKATESIDHPDCLSVFKDNAGVVAFDDAWAVTFKVETHNHPSAIEPYGGAGTGIGGCIRDTLGTGLGAKPIANTDVFCFGRPDASFDDLPPGTLHPRRVMHGVVSGVRDYGNRMGIPTVNGAVHFDPRYVGNPLVFCGSVGLIPRNKIAKAARSGDLIVVLGGRTGRDGIHGATFSSVELTHESETVSSGAVQIGNAIEEKKVLDVLMQARDQGLYSCVTDCGAGGLSSAIGEMGEETGADVDLDKVPLKYAGLTYTEIWISEAQERMVLAVPPERWAALKRLSDDEDVEAVAIGTYTSDQMLRLRYNGQQVGELAMSFLHGGLPKVEREARWNGPVAPPKAAVSEVRPALDPGDCGAALKQILGHPTVASKEWIIRQYDHEVQGRTVLKPLTGARDDGPGDAAVITPVLGQTKGLALSNGLCPQFTDLDPREMAKLAVDEALRNAVAVGADPAKTFILDNFSWGNTSKPEQLGSLALTCDGATEAAIAFGTPFISGKDSLNNEYAVHGQPIAIPGTLLVSAMAIVPDVRACVTMDLKKAGDLIYLIGETREEMGGSHYHLVLGKSPIEGAVPRVHLAIARETYTALHLAMAQGLVRACHDLSEGGLCVAAAEMAFAGELGMQLQLNKVPIPANAPQRYAPEVLLFSESPSRFLVEVTPDKQEAFERALAGIPHAQVGFVMNDPWLTIDPAAGSTRERNGGFVHEDILELKKAWQGAF
ncbi:MAG: phosphoribosylformylglycinamidine synthase subunit PurL [Planctomycetota bacterium]|nr:phosphoribosylformylglycinamidine synthase subunit PurL [Planctomycetota bacterium]